MSSSNNNHLTTDELFTLLNNKFEINSNHHHPEGNQVEYIQQNVQHKQLCTKCEHVSDDSMQKMIDMEDALELLRTKKVKLLKKVNKLLSLDAKTKPKKEKKKIYRKSESLKNRFLVLQMKDFLITSLLECFSNSCMVNTKGCKQRMAAILTKVNEEIQHF
jgi:hypothetical protein